MAPSFLTVISTLSVAIASSRYKTMVLLEWEAPTCSFISDRNFSGINLVTDALSSTLLEITKRGRSYTPGIAPCCIKHELYVRFQIIYSPKNHIYFLPVPDLYYINVINSFMPHPFSKTWKPWAIIRSWLSLDIHLQIITIGRMLLYFLLLMLVVDVILESWSCCWILIPVYWPQRH